MVVGQTQELNSSVPEKETGDAYPVIVDLKVIKDPRGVLCVAQASQHIGFPARRFYFMTDLHPASRRGGHAHKTLRQCFICLRGGFTIRLEKGGISENYMLSDYTKALVIPPGYWRELIDFEEDSLVAVLASEEYDEADYIRDYEDFRRYEAEQRPVPYIDLGRQSAAVGSEIDFAMHDVVRSGTYIGGGALERFEGEFAAYCSTDHAIGFANGLQALSLSLRALGVGVGDEVILPANSFVASALAVTEIGATPVLVDIEPDSYLIDPAAVAGAITARTRAIMPVHLFGHPADMDPLNLLSQRHGLHVVEDACQAHGAHYKGRRCGSLGMAAAFSFYPTKNLGALGDAGAVTCRSGDIARDLRRLGNYGATEKYHHDVIGTNSRLDPLQAAILTAKLPRLDAWNRRRRRLAARYIAGLAEVEDVRLPLPRNWAEPVWHVFAIRVDAGVRDRLRAHLHAAGIGTNTHYPVPIHLQKCYSDQNWSQGDFPNAELSAHEVLSLPLDPFHQDAEIDRVIGAVRQFFQVDRPASRSHGRV